MQQRDNLELRWNAVLREVNADQDAGARQECHLGMANLERLAARQGQLHRLKRAAREHFSKGLNGHKGIIAKLPLSNTEHQIRRHDSAKLRFRGECPISIHQ